MGVRKEDKCRRKGGEYKARLVEKCYSQVSGIDFVGIFYPIAEITSIRLLLSVAAAFDFEVEQMDVKTTFLRGDLEEEIYMKKPEGFAVKGKKELDSKSVKVVIPIGVRLSAEQCPKTQEEEEDMSRVPYTSLCQPGKEHRTIVKRVFRYLCGTSDYGLCYQGRPGLDRVLDIRGFVVADWARDLDQRRSTSGYLFNLFGGAVSWMSKKQYVVALSTTEVEYMATTHARKEAVWLQRFCLSMGLVHEAIRIHYDNQSAIFFAKNPTYHSKTKHIDVQYHFVRDMIEEKKVLLVKVDTLKNTADAWTKSVSSKKFSWCRETIGVSGLEK
eukprot:PITA_22030